MRKSEKVGAATEALWLPETETPCREGRAFLIAARLPRFLASDRLRKNSLGRQFQLLCNKGTASAGPITPIESKLGFSPCKSSTANSSLQGLFPQPVRNRKELRAIGTPRVQSLEFASELHCHLERSLAAFWPNGVERSAVALCHLRHELRRHHARSYRDLANRPSACDD